MEEKLRVFLRELYEIAIEDWTVNSVNEALEKHVEAAKSLSSSEMDTMFELAEKIQHLETIQKMLLEDRPA